MIYNFVSYSYFIKNLLWYIKFTIYYFRLKSETATLVTQKEKLQKKLDKHVNFHKYLERVLESAEEFHEIREIIARYDTLTTTHEVRSIYQLKLFFYCKLINVQC